jgi:hypothetical protein
MSGLSFKEVRWLTIQVIAEEWSRERRTYVSVVTQELQLAIINKERFRTGFSRVDELPPEESRPPVTTELDRDFIEEFCAKQNWPKPKFWFGREDDAPSKVGRPSNMPAIVQELRQIAGRNELKPTLTEQCRVLSDWASASFL